MVRGGSWGNDAVSCRSSIRSNGDPGSRGTFLGFRLARTGAWSSYPFTLGGQNSEVENAMQPATAGSEPAYVPYEAFRDRLADCLEAPEMVYLPGGTFRMGDCQGNGDADEQPVHEVTLDAFAIGRYPVTVGEYMQFVEATGSYHPEWLEEGSAFYLETDSQGYYRNAGVGRDNLDQPIVGISWEDAAAYCGWLSEQTAAEYELPTEAQWEYACRASSEGEYCFGNDEILLEEYS